MSRRLNPRGGEEASSIQYEVFRDLCDDYGRPRLSCARSHFKGLDQRDVPVLAEAFKMWRDYAEYGIVSGENRVNGEKMWFAVKCSKRGNDVFSGRLDRKLGFLNQMDGIELFSLEDFDKKAYMPTNLLWVTLTFNPSICSLDEAWRRFMGDWNLWITNVRNKYGRIKVLRFPEAFPDERGEAFGYPHIHAVLLFQDHTFQTFPRMETNREGKTGVVYRIREKYELERQGKWHSFIDVKALKSGRSLGSYLRKHTKNTHYGDNPGALVTQSLLWLYRKQTYSMSGGFRDLLFDLITGKQGSKIREAQSTLEGGILEDWIWTWHGVRSASDVGAGPGEWFVSLEEARFHKLVDPGG